MWRRAFWLSVAASIVVGAVAAQEADKTLVDQLCKEDVPALRQILAKSPNESAEAAARSGDFRYLMWAGLVGAFPGVEDQRCAMRKQNYKWMRGTSDALCSETHGSLMALAHGWSERYNQRMSELRAANGLDACSLRR
jgi:hypothetical protein